MTTILNTGATPVRVAGRWLQPGETAEVDTAVAQRLMAANSDVVEPGKPTGDDKPTEDALTVVATVEPEVVEPSTPVKRKK